MTTFAIYLIQLWFLIGVVIVLHSLRHRVGLMPYLFVIVTLMVLLNFSTFINIRFQITPDIRLGIAGHLFTPIILMSLMIVYIADGDGLAQFQLAGLIAVNTLTLVLLGFVVAYLSLNLENVIPPAVTSDTFVIDFIFLRRRFASAVSFTISMIVIATVYQFLRNRLRRMPEAIAIALALLMALWTDSFVFFFISDLGLARFFENFQNDLIGKTIASVGVVIPLVWYLTQVVRKSVDYRDISDRPTLAIFFGSGGRLNAALRRVESELHVSRLMYEELTEHIGEIFWLADAKSQKIIYISPAFERLTGHKASDYYQHFSKIQQIVHPDDMDSQVLERWLQPEANEFRIIRADAEIRWVRNRSFLIHDAKGEAYRFAGVIEDFTERKNAHQHEFELAVAQERVKILHNFIRDASHDLKSPLSAILLKLDMLERYSDEQRRQKISGELQDRVRSLSHLIDELFVLSRIEGGDELPQTALIFDEVVAQVVDQFAPIAQEKGLGLAFELQSNGCTLLANKEQLERVVGNLVSNAIRYTQAGNITLKTSGDHSVVKLEISDTGIGIPEADLPNIFERFYRGDNAKDFSGTGLGLAIVKAIVDKHGGEIKVDSVVKQGTTFTVALSCDTEN